MRCKICGKKTDWDTSVGRPCYIVCNRCVESIAEARKKHPFEITGEILKKGLKIEKGA